MHLGTQFFYTTNCALNFYGNLFIKKIPIEKNAI